MTKITAKITDSMTITNGKIMQEIPVANIEGRKTRLAGMIADIDAKIIELQEEKTSIQTKIDDLNVLLAQL